MVTLTSVLPIHPYPEDVYFMPETHLSPFLLKNLLSLKAHSLPSLQFLCEWVSILLCSFFKKKCPSVKMAREIFNKMWMQVKAPLTDFPIHREDLECLALKVCLWLFVYASQVADTTWGLPTFFASYIHTHNGHMAMKEHMAGTVWHACQSLSLSIFLTVTLTFDIFAYFARQLFI